MIKSFPDDAIHRHSPLDPVYFSSKELFVPFITFNPIIYLSIYLSIYSSIQVFEYHQALGLLPVPELEQRALTLRKQQSLDEVKVAA